MIKLEYKVTDPKGMHARPAGILAACAKEYQSTTKFIAGNESVDMKKILPLMGVPVSKGEVIAVEIDGDDEEACAKAVEKALKENF